METSLMNQPKRLTLSDVARRPTHDMDIPHPQAMSRLIDPSGEAHCPICADDVPFGSDQEYTDHLEAVHTTTQLAHWVLRFHALVHTYDATLEDATRMGALRARSVDKVFRLNYPGQVES